MIVFGSFFTILSYFEIIIYRLDIYLREVIFIGGRRRLFWNSQVVQTRQMGSRKKRNVVATANWGNKPGFATMYQVDTMNGDNILQNLRGHLELRCIVPTDGWESCNVFASTQSDYEPAIIGQVRNTAQSLPWIHTLISNIKINIRRIYCGVSPKTSHYLSSEYYFSFNRRF